MKVRILAGHGDDGKKYPVGLKVEHLPKSGVQLIHKDALAMWADWITLSKGQLILHTTDGDVEFAVDQVPGRYCLACGDRLPENGPNGSDEEAKNAKACRDHVADHGDDAVFTDKWPHGYQAHPKSYLCSVVKSKLTEQITNG